MQCFSKGSEEGFTPCLPGKRFSRRNTSSDFSRKYRTLTEHKRGWKPSKIKGFQPFLFLKNHFFQTHQRSSYPTQYPTKFLDIALDILPRLATLDSHIPPFSTHLEHQKAAPSTPSRVCYCSIPCLFNQEVLKAKTKRCLLPGISLEGIQLYFAKWLCFTVFF